MLKCLLIKCPDCVCATGALRYEFQVNFVSEQRIMFVKTTKRESIKRFNHNNTLDRLCLKLTLSLS